MEQNNEKKTKRALGSMIAGKANMIVFVAVIIAISVVLNLIVERIPANLDLTTEKLFTLTDVTTEVLGNLKEKVTIYALYDRLSQEAISSQNNVADVDKILDLYALSPNVDVKFVDLDQNPAFLASTVGAENASNYSRGDYLVKNSNSNNVRRIAASDMFVTQSQQINIFYTQTYTTGIQAETKLTSAIIKVTSDVPVIYYDTSSGIQNLNQYSMIMNYISNNGFDFAGIDLISKDIPDNCAALFYFGPTSDLTAEVEDKVERYMLNGGKAFFFMDALNAKDENKPILSSFDNFNKLLSIYGITIGDSLVKESGDYAVETTSKDSIFYTNTITAGSLENLPNTKIYLINSRNLSIDTMAEHAEPEVILETSIKSTATSLSTGAVKEGKQVVGASSRYTYGKGVSYVAVFGSTQSFSNAALMYYKDTGATVIKQTLGWMKLEASKNVGDSIDAKTYNDGFKSAVVVTAVQRNVLAITVMIVIPLLVVAAGFIIWIRRRHL